MEMTTEEGNDYRTKFSDSTLNETSTTRSLIDVTPLGMCVNLRRWVWSAKEPFARFVRRFYIEESPFPRSFLCPSEAETSLFPCPPPVEPKEACLKPGGKKLNSHEGRKNFLLVLMFACLFVFCVFWNCVLWLPCSLFFTFCFNVFLFFAFLFVFS